MKSLLARIRDCTGFDWDDGNTGKNERAHSVTDAECEETMLGQILAVADSAHSRKEERIGILGKTLRGRELFLVITLRGEKIRVISARDMSLKEREVYNQ